MCYHLLLHPCQSSLQQRGIILLDHGKGIVIGGPAVVGNGCTLLHSVMLRGNGKDVGDCYPKDCATFCLLKVAPILRLVLLSLLWICETWDTSTKMCLKKCVHKNVPRGNSGEVIERIVTTYIESTTSNYCSSLSTINILYLCTSLFSETLLEGIVPTASNKDDKGKSTMALRAIYALRPEFALYHY
jgi:hypothetical protein